MTQFLAEQMRAIAQRLNELDATASPMPTMPVDDDHATQRDVMPTDKLKGGGLNVKLLAGYLGIHDVSMFNRAISKIRAGRGSKLSSRELTQMAVAFVRLLDADVDDTRKALNQLRLVTSAADTKPEEEHLDEDAGPKADHFAHGVKCAKDGKSLKDNPHDPASKEGKEWIKGFKSIKG